MYYSFPANTSFKQFIQKIKQLPDGYFFVMFTFAGCSASLVSKQRYIQSRLQERIPLLVGDVRQSPQIFHHITQAFPKVFTHQRLPVHVCFYKTTVAATDQIDMQPVLINTTILGDYHFEQLHHLLESSSV